MFNSPKTGVSGISLEIVDGGTMEGVLVSNITIEVPECPLFVRLGNHARRHVEEATEALIGVMKNIMISNVIAYNASNYSSKQ